MNLLLALLLLNPLSYHSNVQYAVAKTAIVEGITGRYTSECSAWVIKSNRQFTILVTAKHCIVDGNLGYAKFADGDGGIIVRQISSSEADIGLLEVLTKHSHPAAKIAQSIPLGEPLFVIGDPSNEPFAYSFATARRGGYMNADKGDRTYEIECGSCFHGDSGAGVFDADGEVIGSVSAGQAPDYPSVVAVAPAIYAKKLLSRL